MFNKTELGYVQAGGLTRLARMATVGSDGQPIVDAVGYTYADGTFTVGTHHGDVLATRKGRNVKEGRKHVSLIVDDVESVDPWLPRGIRVQGEAEVVEIDGHFGRGAYLMIRPTRTWSWGLEGSVFELGTHRTDWA